VVPAAADDLTGLRAFGHAANVKSRAFDYRHQYGYVRGVLERVVAARRSWPATWSRAFADHVASHPEITTYARFRAFAEARGTGWHAWPEPQRSGTIRADDVDPEVVAFHEFVQYAMARDLDRLNEGLRERGQRLYLDLPVGAHGDGYDTWRQRDLFAGAGAGAPARRLLHRGPELGLPADAARPRRELLGYSAEARSPPRRRRHPAPRPRHGPAPDVLVPDGMHARDGLYVHCSREALFAVLTLESHRRGCVVVGEEATAADEIRVR
jgi:4-alpha-glucanotransferase